METFFEFVVSQHDARYATTTMQPHKAVQRALSVNLASCCFFRACVSIPVGSIDGVIFSPCSSIRVFASAKMMFQTYSKGLRCRVIVDFSLLIIMPYCAAFALVMRGTVETKDLYPLCVRSNCGDCVHREYISHGELSSAMLFFIDGLFIVLFALV